MKRGSSVIIAALFAFSIAGCAATQKVPVPPVAAAGSAGEVFLASDDAISGGNPGSTSKWHYGDKRRDAPKRQPERKRQTFVVVTELSTSGQEIGDRLVDPPVSGEIVLETVRERLTEAGYAVHMVTKIPGNVSRGIEVSRVSFDVDQRKGLLKDTGTCTLTATVSFFEDGAERRKLDYRVKVSDSALTDRKELASRIVRQSVDNLLTEALPDILASLKK